MITEKLYKISAKTMILMVFYLIGLGLRDAKDISLKGLEAAKGCNKLYLESYTSKMGCDKVELEALFCKDIALADRGLVEQRMDELLLEARTEDVALLVPGDPLSATTHISLRNRARELGIVLQTIHNASILTAVAETGLELYKFGRTVSIPFENEDVASPYDALKKNLSLGLHTLFLLDLRPNEERYMSATEALDYLFRQGLLKEQFSIACAALGTEKQEIIAGPAEKVREHKLMQSPQCLIIPGDMHFVEEETVQRFLVG